MATLGWEEHFLCTFDQRADLVHQLFRDDIEPVQKLVLIATSATSVVTFSHLLESQMLLFLLVSDVSHGIDHDLRGMLHVAIVFLFLVLDSAQPVTHKDKQFHEGRDS